MKPPLRVETSEDLFTGNMEILFRLDGGSWRNFQRYWLKSDRGHLFPPPRGPAEALYFLSEFIKYLDSMTTTMVHPVDVSVVDADQPRLEAGAMEVEA